LKNGVLIVAPSPPGQVWMVVQRKWMYLESIFIGGDIRAQLPEEAKKFDTIDKTFKKVSEKEEGRGPSYLTCLIIISKVLVFKI
jgi:dynein heavy chain